MAQLIGIEAELRHDVNDPVEVVRFTKKSRKERAMSRLEEAGDLQSCVPEPDQILAMAKLGIHPVTQAQTVVLGERYEIGYELCCEELEVGTKVRVLHCGWKTEDGIIVRARAKKEVNQ